MSLLELPSPAMERIVAASDVAARAALARTCRRTRSVVGDSRVRLRRCQSAGCMR